MVNYGFDCVGWSMEKKMRLAAEWGKLLRPYSSMTPPPIIEVDGAYPGVRMRKLTWIPEGELNELIAKADAAYDKIAKG
jgi:hypothetical protein